MKSRMLEKNLKWRIGGTLGAAFFFVSVAAHGDSAPVRVGFDDAVRRAMTRNPTAEVALQEVRRAEALVVQARSGWLPTLTANATYTRLDADRVLADRVIQGANSLSANLQLTVPIIAPKAWVLHARAKDNVDLNKLSAADTQRQVAVATGKAFLTVVGQHRVLETAERARDTAKAHEEFAKTRLSGGVGNKLDAVRAAQERATSETRVQVQSLALTRAQEALGILVGENGPLDAVSDAGLPAPPTLNAAMTEAESHRSDLAAQRERTEIARKNSRDSYVDYLPVLSAIGQPFYQNPSTLTLPTTGWQAQLVLTIPLYDGGNRYGLADERSALHDESKTKLDAALKQARSEVRTAFESVTRADDALKQAREASALAKEALALAELAYKAGATSNIEVVDAERRSFDAETDAAVAEDAARQARLDLLAASGRFP